eukprot:jgi/Picsp_1/1990/NSC_05456-R1_multiple endocrine neoplasia type 1
MGGSEVVASKVGYLESLARRVVDADHDTPSLVAKFSIALGVIENAITLEKNSELSFEPSLVDELYSEFVGTFIHGLHDGLSKFLPCSGPEHSDMVPKDSEKQEVVNQGNDLREVENARRKVKYIADEIWARLNGSAVKNITHAQHVYSFVRYLDSERTVKRRVLDCAGVVTCTYCFCQILASEYGHKDLEGVRMCITEDHCFLTLKDTVCREYTVEVTADSKEKRGLPADENLWNSWLYAGGYPVVCATDAQALVACTASIDYTITKSSVSEELFDLELTLLRFFYLHAREAMYPAAISKLATLEEEVAWDTMALQTSEGLSIAAGQHQTQQHNIQHQWYQSWSTAVSAIHQSAIDACIPSLSTDYGWYWYPYSSLATFYFYQNEFYVYLMSNTPESGKTAFSKTLVLESLEYAIKTCCSGSNVLAKYIHQANDEELYKDVEDIIGKMHAAMKMTDNILNSKDSLSGDNQGSVLTFSTDLLKTVLQFWDNVCNFFSGKPKPSKWIKQMIQVSTHFDSESRSQAVQCVAFTSWTMQAAAPHLIDLKPRALLPLFEAADPGPACARNRSSDQNHDQEDHTATLFPGKRRSTVPSSRASLRQVRHRV